MSIPIRKNNIVRFADSIGYIFSLDMKQKESIANEIFQKQSQLLFEAIGLHHLKVPAEKIEHVINLLLILYDYFSDRGSIELPMVSEKMIDEATENIVSMLQLLDKEGSKTGWPLMKKGIEAYPEIEALAFYIGYMNDHGFAEKTRENEYCLRAGKVILDCFMRVNNTGYRDGGQLYT